MKVWKRWMMALLLIPGLALATGCNRTPEAKADWALNRLQSKLDLTDAQRNSLEPFKVELVAHFNAIKEHHKKVTDEVIRQLESGVSDPAKLDQLRAEGLKEMTAVGTKGQAAFTTLLAQLTPEQRATAVEELKDWLECHGHR